MRKLPNGYVILESTSKRFERLLMELRNTSPEVNEEQAFDLARMTTGEVGVSSSAIMAVDALFEGWAMRPDAEAGGEFLSYMLHLAHWYSWGGGVARDSTSISAQITKALSPYPSAISFGVTLQKRFELHYSWLWRHFQAYGSSRLDWIELMLAIGVDRSSACGAVLRQIQGNAQAEDWKISATCAVEAYEVDVPEWLSYLSQTPEVRSLDAGLRFAALCYCCRRGLRSAAELLEFSEKLSDAVFRGRYTALLDSILDFEGDLFFGASALIIAQSDDVLNCLGYIKKGFAVLLQDTRTIEVSTGCFGGVPTVNAFEVKPGEFSPFAGTLSTAERRFIDAIVNKVGLWNFSCASWGLYGVDGPESIRSLFPTVRIGVL